MLMHKGVSTQHFESDAQLAWSSDGTGKHAATAQMYHDAGYWVMATDVSNAANAMDTIGIVDGLSEVAPAVVNYKHTDPCSLQTSRNIPPSGHHRRGLSH